MRDRIVEHPNRYMLVPVDGSDNLFDLIPAPGEILEAGTPLNKGSLLTDPLCTSLGLSTAATPTQAMDKLRVMAEGRAQIATGTYTGTGKYGSNNPNSLTFPFQPKILFVSYEDSNPLSNSDGWRAGLGVMWVFGAKKIHVSYGPISDYGGIDILVSTAGNSITWYTSASGNTSSEYAACQFNSNGINYRYLAIG